MGDFRPLLLSRPMSSRAGKTTCLVLRPADTSPYDYGILYKMIQKMKTYASIATERRVIIMAALLLVARHLALSVQT